METENKQRLQNAKENFNQVKTLQNGRKSLLVTYITKDEELKYTKTLKRDEITHRGSVVHAFNPSSWEAEARKSLYRKRNETKRNEAQLSRTTGIQ